MAEIKLPKNVPQDLREELSQALDESSLESTIFRAARAVQRKLRARLAVYSCELLSAPGLESVQIFGAAGTAAEESSAALWREAGIDREVRAALGGRFSAISHSSFSWPFPSGGSQPLGFPRPYTLLVPFSSELIVMRRYERGFFGYFALCYDDFPDLADDSVSLIVTLPLLLSEYVFAAQRTFSDAAGAGAVAHDVKQFLLLSEQMLYRLRRSLEEGRTEASVEIVRRMEASFSQMMLTCNSLMLAERDINGTLKVRPMDTDLNELLRDVLRAFEARFEFNSVAVKAELSPGLPKAFIDPAIFPAVLNNLLDNAVKYGNPQRDLRVRTLANGAGRVTVEVADNGLGIEEAERSKIFDKNFRGDNTKGLSGAGLGLYLVRKILDAHGGTIEVDADDDYRTIFRIELPRAEETAA